MSAAKPSPGSMPDTRDLLDLMALTHVPRWAIMPMLRPQTVAEHSYRVTIIMNWMVNQIHVTHPLPGGGPDFMGPRVWAYALSHDVEEARTGDIPGPAKRRVDGGIPDFLDWTPEQRNRWCIGQWGSRDHIKLVLKLADLIEAYTWLQRWGSPCDHRSRVLVELWGDIKGLCDDLQSEPYPKPTIGWYELAKWVRDALVYEAR